MLVFVSSDFHLEPLERNRLAELQQFLLGGFDEPQDAEFASLSVLDWKYFDPVGSFNGPRALLATVDGRIVSCIGVCPTQLVVGNRSEQISASHAIDWLADRKTVSAGLAVYQRSETYSDVQFAIGGTEQALAIKRKLGYTFPLNAAVYVKVLRPWHRLRPGGADAGWKAALKVARDYARRISSPLPPLRMKLDLRRIRTFGSEIEDITRACAMSEVHTLRSPDLLNHLLRYPLRSVSGWLFTEGSRTRGFALLSTAERHRTRIGRIVDCFMDHLDQDLWQSALHALTNQFDTDSVDIAVCYATTPWMANALEHVGFHQERLSPVSLRDPKHLIPTSASFYLTHLEGDHAYF